MSQLLANFIKQQGIHDSRIVQAFAQVQRHDFIAERLADSADLDMPLPIGTSANHITALCRSTHDGIIIDRLHTT